MLASAKQLRKSDNKHVDLSQSSWAWTKQLPCLQELEPCSQPSGQGVSPWTPHRFVQHGTYVTLHVLPRFQPETPQKSRGRLWGPQEQPGRWGGAATEGSVQCPCELASVPRGRDLPIHGYSILQGSAAAFFVCWPSSGQRIWKQHGKDPMGEAPGATKTSKHKGLTQQPLSLLPSPCRAWRPRTVHAVFPQSLHTHKMLWCLLVPRRHYKKKGTKDFNSMRHSRTIKSHAAKAMYK